MSDDNVYTFSEILDLTVRCVDTYGLSEALDYVVSNNEASGAYHNTQHLMGVTGIMLYLWGVRDTKSHPYSVSEVRSVILAGLFHDMNHLCMGPDIDDNENILASLCALKTYQSTEGARYPDYVFDLSCRMIEDSHYPYRTNAPISLSLLLRDADLLYTMFNNSALIGLFEEYRYTKRDFYRQQMDFLHNLKFNYPKARRIAKLLRPQQFNYLNSIWGEI